MKWVAVAGFAVGVLALLAALFGLSEPIGALLLAVALFAMVSAVGVGVLVGQLDVYLPALLNEVKRTKG